jgi:hypothetical protein
VFKFRARLLDVLDGFEKRLDVGPLVRVVPVRLDVTHVLALQLAVGTDAAGGLICLPPASACRVAVGGRQPKSACPHGHGRHGARVSSLQGQGADASTPYNLYRHARDRASVSVAESPSINVTECPGPVTSGSVPYPNIYRIDLL